MKIKAILTGATGMVGEGVLLVCLNHPEVEQVLVINRKPCGISHPKLKEIIHDDFLNLVPIEDQLKGYNACFFCLGVSSVGMKEDQYYKTTYDLTLNFAKTLLKYNNDLTFCYVSGAGTDSSEKGRIAWARVKGKTENDLLKLGFKQAYMFRPAFIQPIEGSKNTKKFYYTIKWVYYLFNPIFPNYFISLKEIGKAMINTVNKGYNKTILNPKDIKELAK